MTNHLFDGLLGRADTSRRFAALCDGRTCSYGAVIAASAQFANVLVELGVEPGDRVAVQAPKSIDALMLYLGCLRAGAVFLPLNTAYTCAEIEYFLDDAEPRIFVCDPEKRNALSAAAEKRGIVLKTLGVESGSLADAGRTASAEFQNIRRGADDLAAILYTSGTTGRSKGAMLTHDNLLSNAHALVNCWRFTADDILLHALPIFHTHGLFVASNVTLLAGGSMVFLPGFDVAQVIRSLPGCTAMMGVPTFYTRLLAEDGFTRDLVSHMRLFVSGSAPLLAETHQAFEQRTGHRILERYGMTETNMNASNPEDRERRAGTVGFPLPGTEIRITDPASGETLDKGKTGMIEVRGRNVFKGYWRRPDKTSEELRDNGFFITGDLGRFDEDGYLQIVGRSKDLIITGGYNVYPKELELLLDEQEGVEESAVIGVPHPDFGEGVVGVVVPSVEGSADTDAIMDSMRDKVARFKQPKRLFVIDSLPRNAMGKVQKKILRERFRDTFAR